MTTAVLAVLALLGAAAAWTAWARSEGTPRGFAPGMAIVEAMSTTAVRRRALHTRPATRTTWRALGRDVGIELGRAGWRWLFASLEDTVLYISGTRTGKTGSLARHVQDAPGAVLVTSSRPDLYRNTVEARRRRPIWVFSPDDVGGITTDPARACRVLRWSPVIGCRRPRHAMLVAALLVSGGDTGKMRDAAFWESNAVRALRCLLAAADLAGQDMRAVVRWSALDQDRPVELLERDGPDGWAADLRKLQDDTAENTLSSIVTTVATCLQFMADPVLEHAATPRPDEHFDVDDWLRTGGTVHIIGTRREHSPVGPLFAALSGCLYERAVDVAARSRGGRLDPPCAFVLDEVAKTLRVPLAQWTADAGGFGIPIVIAAQDRNQLREAFGDHDAAAIWSLASTKVILGGQSDPELLRDVSELCGTRAVEIGSKARRPIMTPADIRELPAQHALVLTRACPPVIARIPMVWERKNPPVAEPLVAVDEGVLAEVVRLDDHRRSA